MFLLHTILLTYTFITFGDAAYAKTWTKCSTKDDGCLTKLYEDIIRSNAKSGIKEYDIPSLDPMILQKNLTMTVLDILSLTVSNGRIYGISGCTFHNVHLDIEKSVATIELVCNLILKGEAILSGEGDIIQALLGQRFLDTHGKCSMKLDEVRYKYNSSFVLYTKDGEVYLRAISEGIKYIFDLKKATLSGEKFMFGKQDISPLIVGYFNSNWKTIAYANGHSLLSHSMDQYFVHANKFFSNVPVKDYLIEDLSSYIKN